MCRLVQLPSWRSNTFQLNSFVPHICAIFSWLICQLLENHVTNNIFLELADSPWEAERHFKVSRATTWLVWKNHNNCLVVFQAFLNIMDVTPRGCAWFVLICTWRVVRNYVSFYTMYYEGYLIIVGETIEHYPRYSSSSSSWSTFLEQNCFFWSTLCAMPRTILRKSPLFTFCDSFYK